MAGALSSSSAIPAVFVISMPIALLDPTAATLSWLSLILVGRIADRRRGSAAVGGG